jgi:hypothetical protein
VPHRISIPLDRAVVEEDPEAEFVVPGRELLKYVEAVERFQECSTTCPARRGAPVLDHFSFGPPTLRLRKVK